jgi:hypothetical protein
MPKPKYPTHYRVTPIGPVVIADQRRFDAAQDLLVGMIERQLDACSTLQASDQAEQHPIIDSAPQPERAAK